MVGVTIADPRTALKASVAALVAGRVLFPDVNGNIVQDSNLFWDNTNKRLGIGTSSPGVRLQVDSTSDSATSWISLTRNAPPFTSGLNIAAVGGGTDSGFTGVSKGDCVIRSDTGNLHLGVGGGIPTITMVVSQTPTITGGFVGIGGTPTHILQLVASDDAAKTTTNTWTVTSDKRLKKNITPFIDGLAVLLQLNPINFQFTGDGGTPKDAQGIGLAAQDIENITPYMIRKTKGKIKDTDLVETDIYKMNNHALVYILVNAVKELSAEVTTLRNRLASAGIP